ncbi:hypothetical protein KI387_019334, partial [Taxus chinensis]
NVALNCKKRSKDLHDDKIDQKALLVEDETDWDEYSKDEEISCPSDEEFL